MLNSLKYLFNHEERELKKFKIYADKVEALSDTYSKLTDEELKAKTIEFKKRIEEGEVLEKILPEAFATAREAAFRVIGEKPYYVQLVGGIAIHFGNIAEMKTGEGKTLTSVLPSYLNALEGKGVHVVTVNEYLAERDANWMGEIFRFLGLTVGVNLRDLSPEEKKKVYECDITYTTNNELGFDYLRDNMVVDARKRTLRGLNFAIVDEVDSILIDEARTPLIISGGFMRSMNLYKDADAFVKRLKAKEDYEIDEKTKSINLTDAGSQKAETTFKLTNLYDIANSGLVHHINQALRANYIMHLDVDYVVSEGEVVIVDPFTGRLMVGRQYSEGLHQAIEAKEGLKVQEETQTLATITFQNLFRMYKKLSGMTGTAKTEEEEFRNIYNMYVITVPTNRDVVRIDEADLLYADTKSKFNAVVKEIEERYKKGQPVLVGTIAIETNELISQLLEKKKIPHEVLNAKNHAREAEIIAKAGQKKSVTIATNMAGRGTDIKLGEGVKELGGLCVIGTERHESRRIDNQLRGRAGRQGDPGFSQFYVSLEDDLMIRFGSDRIKGLLASVGLGEDNAIRSRMFSRSIETAQKRVEGYNYDTRKQLLEYDDVMNQQRELMYKKRNDILDNENIHEFVLEAIQMHIDDLVNKHVNEDGKLDETSRDTLLDAINNEVPQNMKIRTKDIDSKSIDETKEVIKKMIIEGYEDKLDGLTSEMIHDFEKAIYLTTIDRNWMQHINDMEHLREGIGLRGYGQMNPLQAYTTEGYALFDDMISRIDKQTTMYLLKAEIRQNLEVKPVAKANAAVDESKTIKKKPKKSEKVGRNDLCPCGSGKKYKQCCGK